VVAFVENAVRIIKGSEKNNRLMHIAEAEHQIDYSGPFDRRRRLAQLAQPHQTSENH
jgi:hypothetical protein